MFAQGTLQGINTEIIIQGHRDFPGQPKTPWLHHQEFEYVATKLGVSVKELQNYMDLPKKTYKDYKSQRSIYNIGAKVLKMLGLEIGGKR